MEVMGRYGMLVLSAAVSDFYVPRERLRAHKIDSGQGRGGASGRGGMTLHLDEVGTRLAVAGPREASAGFPSRRHSWGGRGSDSWHGMAGAFVFGLWGADARRLCRGSVVSVLPACVVRARLLGASGDLVSRGFGLRSPFGLLASAERFVSRSSAAWGPGGRVSDGQQRRSHGYWLASHQSSLLGSVSSEGSIVERVMRRFSSRSDSIRQGRRLEGRRRLLTRMHTREGRARPREPPGEPRMNAPWSSYPCGFRVQRWMSPVWARDAAGVLYRKAPSPEEAVGYSQRVPEWSFARGRPSSPVLCLREASACGPLVQVVNGMMRVERSRRDAAGWVDFFARVDDQSGHGRDVAVALGIRRRANRIRVWPLLVGGHTFGLAAGLTLFSSCGTGQFLALSPLVSVAPEKQVPKCLGLIRAEWAPECFRVSFKLETDQSRLIPKARASLER